MNQASPMMKQSLNLPNTKKFNDPAFVVWLYRQFSRQPTDDDTKRPIWVTPYPGAYSREAGYIIIINGTPPRGTMIAETSSYCQEVTLLHDGMVRTGAERHYGMRSGKGFDIRGQRWRDATRFLAKWGVETGWDSADFD